MSDRKNLQRWQATSHPDLATRKPEELFQPEFVERYSRLHNDLWQRIVRLHGTIHTLETLADFPFDHLHAPTGMEFWRLVEHNFVDIAIVLLHGLVNDHAPDAHAMASFKNKIAKEPWLDQRMRDVFLQTLQVRKFDEDVASVAVRVRQIRHNHIAHRLIDKQTGYLKDQCASVSLQELRKLFDAAHSLFGALSFGAAYVTLNGDLMPGTSGGKPTRTCLDKMLDAVIRESDFVNEPELMQPWWPDIREHMAPEKLRTMNELRTRVGLPEA